MKFLGPHSSNHAQPVVIILGMSFANISNEKSCSKAFENGKRSERKIIHVRVFQIFLDAAFSPSFNHKCKHGKMILNV